MLNKIMIGLALFFILTSTAPSLEISTLDVHGFISQGYMNSSTYDFIADSKGGTLRFNELGINLSTMVHNDLRIGMQLASRGLGDLADNAIELDWAVIDYHWRDWLGLRLGKVKIPIGFYTDAMDLDVARSQIIPPTSVYNLYLQDILLAITGASVYGNVGIGTSGDLDYTVFFGNTSFKVDSTLSLMMSKMGMNLSTANSEHTIGANIKWNSPFGLRLNTTYLYTNNVAAGGTFSSLSVPFIDLSQISPGLPLNLATMSAVLDPASLSFNFNGGVAGMAYGAEYNWHDLSLLAEYLVFNQKNDLIVTHPLGSITTPVNIGLGGWYGQISYRVNEWFEVSSYYSAYYNDIDDKDGNQAIANGSISKNYQAWQKDVAITGRFDLNENWVIKLEGHFMDGAALTIGTPTDQNWFLWALKTTFTF